MSKFKVLFNDDVVFQGETYMSREMFNERIVKPLGDKVAMSYFDDSDMRYKTMSEEEYNAEYQRYADGVLNPEKPQEYDDVRWSLNDEQNPIVLDYLVASQSSGKTSGQIDGGNSHQM